MTPIRGGPHATDNDKDSARSAGLDHSGGATGIAEDRVSADDGWRQDCVRREGNQRPVERSSLWLAFEETALRESSSKNPSVFTVDSAAPNRYRGRLTGYSDVIR